MGWATLGIRFLGEAAPAKVLQPFFFKCHQQGEQALRYTSLREKVHWFENY